MQCSAARQASEVEEKNDGKVCVRREREGSLETTPRFHLPVHMPHRESMQVKSVG